jgi:hypothetical protein
VAGHGPVAVELVALDAESTRLRLNNMFITSSVWQKALQARVPAERQALQTDLINAAISLHFSNGAGARDRSDALGALQAFLAARPGFDGDVTAEDLRYPKGFDSAQVRRFNQLKNGPAVTAPSGDYFRGPQVEKIVEKLRDKEYQTNASLELFAYSNHDDPDGAVGSLEAIQTAVVQHLADSMFRRVHVFHLGFLQHVWSSA